MRFNAKKSAARSGSARKPRAKPRQAAREPLISLTPDQWLDVLGAFLIGVAAITILSAISPGGQGTVTAAWFLFLRGAFGWMAYAAPVVLGAFGWYLVQHHFGSLPQIGFGRLVGVVAAFLTLLMLLHLVGMAITQPDGAKPQPNWRAAAASKLRSVRYLRAGAASSDSSAAE